MTEYIDTALLVLILWAVSNRQVKGYLRRHLINWRNR